MWNGTRGFLALAAAALLAGCMTELEDGDTDTSEEVECGDYGYGGTSCEEVAVNLEVCCPEDVGYACEQNLPSFENHCSNGDLDDLLDYCSCDDCEDPESEECEEFVNCIESCNWVLYTT